MAIVNGFGRGGWGQLTWGEPIPVVVTGVAGTSALGNETVQANADVDVTNNLATTAVGAVAVQAFAVVGVSAVASTLGLGDETLITNNNLSVSGFGVTVSQGSVDTDAQAVISAIGNQAEALTQSVQVWSLINAGQIPNYTIISNNKIPEWEEVA